MLIRIIKSYRNVVAICDDNLLGKRFEEGGFQLDVKESFFKGDSFDEESAINIIRKMSIEDSTFNIVGEEAIRTAMKAGIISEDNIKRIDNIPFAMVLI